MKRNQKIPVNSRRDFIKKSAIAATGVMIIPRHVMGGAGFIAPSDKLIVAGIGIILIFLFQFLFMKSHTDSDGNMHMEMKMDDEGMMKM